MALIRLLVLCFTIVAAAAACSTRDAAPASIDLPESLGSRTLADVATGEDAMAQISRLHDKTIEVSAAVAARYEGTDGRTFVWVSLSPSEKEADELFVKMDELMPSSSVFTDRTELNAGDVPMVRVFGMGMNHYYWVTGPAVVWVSVSGGNDEEQVEELFAEMQFSQ